MDGSRRSPPADVRCDAERRRIMAPGRSDVVLDVRAAVAKALADALPGGGRIAIALSGGRDSSVLLDAAHDVATGAHRELVALHVHHGLSANADAWSQFCRDLCAARGVAFHLQHVRVQDARSLGVEAAARRARYAALERLAREHACDAVLLAHHADDQAETTLLQLLRGAGPRGLAAMPAIRCDGGVCWLRPLLSLPRATLDAYAAERALRYVDDDSNADGRYRRNALRSTVVPLLRSIAPGFPATLVRAAELQGEAMALLDDLARLDALSSGPDAQGSGDGTTLDRARFAILDGRRAANLLRWFLREQRLPAPSRARLAEMVRQLTGAAADARIEIAHAGARLSVHRGRIVVHRPAPAAFACPWTGEDSIVLPHGTLRLERRCGAGIAIRHLGGTRVTIRSGAAGERLRFAAKGARRRVVDLLREAGVPRWDRASMPRVYCGDTLAAVAGLGADADFAANPREDALALVWHSTTASPGWPA